MTEYESNDLIEALLYARDKLHLFPGEISQRFGEEGKAGILLYADKKPDPKAILIQKKISEKTGELENIITEDPKEIRKAVTYYRKLFP